MNSTSTIGRTSVSGIVLSLVALLAGCSGRASLLPNSDPALRKTSTEFAVDSAKRFPFKGDAPQGGAAIGRAQVGYMVKRVEIVNLSADDWTNLEVWVNQKYVVYLPLMKPHDLKELPFQMMFDDKGEYFPGENSKPDDAIVKKVQIFMGGKMYDVPLQLAD
jgi:hypothetical protein